MYKILQTIIVTTTALCVSFQSCPQETYTNGISVTWRESEQANNVGSDPPCYNSGRLITRNCNDSEWTPPLKDLETCYKVVELYDPSFCPPGFQRVSTTSNKYCYQISPPSSWNDPCLTSGGASIITDLNTDEFQSLLQSLSKSNESKYWLPAQRRKNFTPVVWNIPGPNWGQEVDREDLLMLSSLLRNCLMLDTQKSHIMTEVCSKELPSLCIYLNNLDYPAKCPDGYYGFRFMSDSGICFGIEQTLNATGLAFDDFINSKCNKPMGDSKYRDLTKYVFVQMAEVYQLPENVMCWFATTTRSTQNSSTQLLDQNNTFVSTETPVTRGAINSNGTLSFISGLSTLPCMACETRVTLVGATELELEYNPEGLKLYLTIYFPSGLWKYDNNDIGVQCFSDAKGFVKPIDVNNVPFLQIDPEYNEQMNNTYVEKIVYTVDLVTNRSAQYWCEAHNKSFSLLKSSKIIASSKSNTLHVFALLVRRYVNDNESIPDMTELVVNLTDFFKAEKALLMDIFEYTSEHIMFLIHLHVGVTDEFEDETSNLLATFEALKSKATNELPLYGLTFVNISSSLYCLPTVSYDHMLLEWEQTKVGEVAAPKQFCLQANGLPVKRHCLGSYLIGGTWGEVEGHCNETYEPSLTTTFLYNFVKGQVPENCTTTFLTDGLEFVLDDVNIIIPADIYYLSMSFQHIVNILKINESSVEMGDIENMAWAVDRILLMDSDYLRLSQTFNSTNVILDCVNDIIEKLSDVNVTANGRYSKKTYQLSVRPQFIVQVSYPLFNNVTGLAIIKSVDSDKFTDMLIQPLYTNSSIDDVLLIENLEIATWVPDIVLKTLRTKSNTSHVEPLIRKDIHIVITVYHSDAIFQQLDASNKVINSRIIGLTIPGYNTNLINPIPLLFKELKSNNSEKLCGFWDFQTKKKGHNPGFWSNRGCFVEKSAKNITVCQCYHMTNFGQLLDISEIRQPDGGSRYKCHLKALNIITLVGSFMSLFGIIGIWITALVFQTWRKKPGTKVLLQLSTAIALPLIMMIVFNLDNTIFYEKDSIFAVWEHKKIVCVILGSLLQYSILASFMWMLITAVLQFIRYVRVLGVCRPSRFMCKFAIVGWGIPLVPVIITLSLDFENYIPNPTTDPENRICYPKGFYLLIGIILPIIVVLIVNVALFLSVLFSISRGPEGKMKSSDMDLIKTQLRLSLFLFFLLGLTWIFGIFSFNSNLIWSYLFCLTSTLQGFVLFIYFVICDPATRNLWITLMTPQFMTPSSRKSITSISSS